jgi:uncharacterized membrane protein YhaH (DUF805 family)
VTAELLLNVLWVAVAAFAVARLALARERRWIAVAATLCIVALLFPIISVTDDFAHDATLTEAKQLAAALDVVPQQTLVFTVVLLVVTVIAAAARPGFATTIALRGPPSVR